MGSSRFTFSRGTNEFEGLSSRTRGRKTRIRTSPPSAASDTMSTAATPAANDVAESSTVSSNPPTSPPVNFNEGRASSREDRRSRRSHFVPPPAEATPSSQGAPSSSAIVPVVSEDTQTPTQASSLALALSETSVEVQQHEDERSESIDCWEDDEAWADDHLLIDTAITDMEEQIEEGGRLMEGVTRTAENKRSPNTAQLQNQNDAETADRPNKKKPFFP